MENEKMVKIVSCGESKQTTKLTTYMLESLDKQFKDIKLVDAKS